MGAAPELALIVAVSRNGVIGKDGDLPWHIPEDLKHFRRHTVGHCIIMGRKTWDSIGRPLPKRRSIVVTRQQDLVLHGAGVVPSLAQALALAWASDPEPRVIGGATLYRAAFPQATRLILTEVQRDVEGDIHFPAWDEADWQEVARASGTTEGVVFRELERR
jgi:dihydrofolate reductase